MLHNNEHALSRWTLDYNYFARIIAAVGRGQQMCLLTVTQVSSLLVCVWLTAVWVEPRADSRDYYSYCPERNSAKSALSLVCCSCTTDWRAFRVSDNTARTHTQTSYRALSWPCTGPQHLRWHWSLHWVLLFLCWPATWKKWTQEDYSWADFLKQLILPSSKCSSNCNIQIIQYTIFHKTHNT